MLFHFFQASEMPCFEMSMPISCLMRLIWSAICFMVERIFRQHTFVLNASCLQTFWPGAGTCLVFTLRDSKTSSSLYIRVNKSNVGQ